MMNLISLIDAAAGGQIGAEAAAQAKGQVASNASVTAIQTVQAQIPRGFVLMQETLLPGLGVPDVVWLLLFPLIFVIGWAVILHIKMRGLPWLLGWHRGDTFQITALASGRSVLFPVRHSHQGADRVRTKNFKGHWFHVPSRSDIPTITEVKGFKFQLATGKFGATIPWETGAASTALARDGIGGMRLDRAKDAALVIRLAMQIKSGIPLQDLIGKERFKTVKNKETKEETQVLEKIDYTDDWSDWKELCEVLTDVKDLEAVANDPESGLTDEERTRLWELIAKYGKIDAPIQKADLDVIAKAKILTFKVSNINLVALNEHYKNFNNIASAQINDALVEEELNARRGSENKLVKMAIIIMAGIIISSIVGAIILSLAM